MITDDGKRLDTIPDSDGDKVTVRKVFGQFTFKVENSDGDFMAALVERDEAVALARWILQDEA